MATEILVCGQCKREYERQRGRTTRYCSVQCAAQSRVGKKRGPYRAEHRETVLCQRCGRQFESTQGSTGKYCSPECYHQARVGVERGPYKGFEPQSRTCPVCEKQFEVGPYERTGRWWGTIYCSTACAKSGSPKRSLATCNQLSDTDAAYLAGLVDGEGSIFLYRKPASVVGRLIVTNTYRPVIDWLIETTGAGGVGTHTETEKHKQGFMWAVNGTIAEDLVRQIRPYLIIKGAQADLMLDLCEKRRVPSLKADLSWQLEYQEKMQAMNRRGPKARE